MEYEHGQRLTPLYHEMTPLEAAIERYSKQVSEYYKNNKTLTSAEARKAKQEALKHLEQERRLAEIIVDVQTDLENYRASGRAATLGTRSEVNEKQIGLGLEKHHPTYYLAKYMRADGRPQPSSKHTAHHIIPGKGKTKLANRARLHMHRYGLRINDPDNGAWLVRKKSDTPHWSMPKSSGHLAYHTHNYEIWIYESIRVGRNEQAVRAKLGLLGQMLQDGNQPKQVTLPPDESWDGR